MNKQIITNLRQELKQNIDPATVEIGQKFFKEQIKFYGVKSAVVSKIGKKYYEQIKELDKKEIFSLCEELCRSDYNEEAWIAFMWSEKLHKQFQPEDFKVFERWLNKYINNWAKCDTLCNHTVAEFVMKYPKYIKELKEWTLSKNRWLRRAAAVTLIIPARKGLFLKDIFEIADKLLMDKDDLVQKGYGWMLKAASEPHQKEVFAYVVKNKNVMPRTALRYAIEKLPKEMKAKAMAK